MKRSHEIIEILADVVKCTSAGCTLIVPDSQKQGLKKIGCPEINYTFGNAKYVKDRLDALIRTPMCNTVKFHLLSLLCPLHERPN